MWRKITEFMLKKILCGGKFRGGLLSGLWGWAETKGQQAAYSPGGRWHSQHIQLKTLLVRGVRKVTYRDSGFYRAIQAL